MIEPGRGPSRFLDAVARDPLILDAAMGTRLVARGVALDRDDPCLWNLTHPAAVGEVHALDLAAGSDAILTNTFGANRCWLARYGLAGETAAINRRAAAIARAAAGPGRFVIGSIGPTAAAEPSAYTEQAEALAGSGVDALIFETHRMDEATIALRSVRPAVALPLVVSLVVWSGPVDEHVRILEGLGADAIGGNCQSGMAGAVETSELLAPFARLPILLKPSAGRPGDPLESPEEFAAAVPMLLTRGVRLLGGCCGTTEAHVAALRAACYHSRGMTTAGAEG